VAILNGTLVAKTAFASQMLSWRKRKGRAIIFAEQRRRFAEKAAEAR
jgi:hypothetical protein